MIKDNGISPKQVVLNRWTVVQYLLHNPNRRDKIQLALTDGDNGRCAIGLGMEALGFDMTTVPSDCNSDYMTFENSVGYPDPDEKFYFPGYKDATSISEVMWTINDNDETTFTDVGKALAKGWGFAV